MDIYLPSTIQTQAISTDPHVLARPIPFKREPEQGFTNKVTLSEDTLELDSRWVLAGGNYYPGRDQDLENTLESIEQVEAPDSPPQVAQKFQSPTPGQSTIYRRFEGNSGDGECWASYDGNIIKSLAHNTYNFLGLLSGPSSFHLTQERTFDRILSEGAGIHVNRRTLPLCSGKYNMYEGGFDKRIMSFTSADKVSIDGVTYKVFQDYDRGAKGWALFTAKEKNSAKVLCEGHVYEVRDWMLSGDIITSLGIELDFLTLERNNHDFYSGHYFPTTEDFGAPFDIDYGGGRTYRD